MNRFSKTCLLVITLLLAVIASRPIVSPQPVVAAAHYQYLVVQTSWQSDAIQAELDKRVVEGWELAAPVYFEGQASVTLIFRKETR
jgi:hypothetical protein